MEQSSSGDCNLSLLCVLLFTSSFFTSPSRIHFFCLIKLKLNVLKLAIILTQLFKLNNALKEAHPAEFKRAVALWLGIKSKNRPQMTASPKAGKSPNKMQIECQNVSKPTDTQLNGTKSNWVRLDYQSCSTKRGKTSLIMRRRAKEEERRRSILTRVKKQTQDKKQKASGAAAAEKWIPFLFWFGIEGKGLNSKTHSNPIQFLLSALRDSP